MSKEKKLSQDESNVLEFSRDWNLYAKMVLGVNLDTDQQEILSAIQTERRVSVRSGTARGKDFVAAVAAICFYMLTPMFDDKKMTEATKVAMIAPTGRQIKNIMIPEISKLYNRAKFIHGELMADGIRSKIYKDWFITGFKAADENIEAWSGFHAPNVMVLITEASGISQSTFDAIEGILQGNSRLVLMFNPNNIVGEAYASQRSPQYKKFRLNDLNAPNVINYKRFLDGEITREEYRELRIPGQVDYNWVDEKIKKPGWVVKIPKETANETNFDFEWNGSWYRPNDLFRVKVLGEFPEEAEGTLVPMSWIEAANNRWDEITASGFTAKDPLRIGTDVAGMGRDNTIHCKRYGHYVHKFDVQPMPLNRAEIHMSIAGTLVQFLRDRKTKAFIDTIGEGAGVYSRLIEQKYGNAYSAKASYNARNLSDLTGERRFTNMRAFMYWALRDAMNPAFNDDFALPKDEELIEELSNTTYEVDSSGKIKIVDKADIIENIGRSPDKSDALALTFFPDWWVGISDFAEEQSKASLGLF